VILKILGKKFFGPAPPGDCCDFKFEEGFPKKNFGQTSSSLVLRSHIRTVRHDLIRPALIRQGLGRLRWPIPSFTQSGKCADAVGAAGHSRLAREHVSCSRKSTVSLRNCASLHKKPALNSLNCGAATSSSNFGLCADVSLCSPRIYNLKKKLGRQLKI
jgi:hypothetical protein